MTPVLLLCLALAAPPDDMPKDAVEMRVRVTDATGKAVSGASVYLNTISDGANPQQSRYAVPTGADGVALVKRYARPQSLQLFINPPPGLVRGYWGLKADASNEKIPDEVTFALPAAVTAGGRVVDAAGKGVPGVAIDADCTLNDSGDLPNAASINTTLAYKSLKTDADGRWTLRNVPKSVKSFELRVYHPDYVSDEFTGDIQRAQGVTTEQLLKGEAVMRLSPGARVTGTVTGPDGKPVAKALVVFHRGPYGMPGSQEVRTDDAGRYTLPVLKPGTHPITVVAKGFAPQDREVTLSAGASVEDFRLAPGRLLRVRVVDEKGDAVPGATFSLENWHRRESLYNHVHSSVLPSGIPDQAGKDGVFEWTWAPEDSVEFTVLAQGFRYQRFNLSPSETTQTITLRRPSVFTGSVVDAATGKPIDGARVTPVDEFDPGREHVDRQGTVFAKGGRYSIELDRDDVDYRLWVEADGYRAAVSPPSLRKAGKSAVDFKLERAEPIRGRVLGTDGKPVANADVVLGTTAQRVRWGSDWSSTKATTGPDGAFALPAQFEAYQLVVRTNAGFARAFGTPAAAPGDLTLTPWASLRGSIRQDGKPVSGVRVVVSPTLDGPSKALTIEANEQPITDDKGEFRVPQLPPGPATVRVDVGPWEDSPLSAGETRQVVLKAGETTVLEMGTGGATVAGRLRLTGDVPPDLTYQYTINYLVSRTPGPVPPGVRRDLERVNEILKQGDKASRVQFYVKVDKRTGAFRVSGVPAGEYWFATEVHEKPVGCLVNPVGVAAVPVTVPASGAVEIPPLEIPVSLPTRVGQPLPALDLTDAEGKPIDLSQYRGRHVLLHGWAGWCVPCSKDYHAVRKLAADTGRERLAVVGLNLDTELDEARRLTAKNQFAWPQACAAQPQRSEWAKTLKLRSIPAYLVLGPDGALLYRGGNFHEADTLVRRRLAE